jgi:regulator of replication initiation timing
MSSTELEKVNCNDFMEGVVQKMFGMFESFTNKIIDQMNTNFLKQNELVSSEIFDLKIRLDNLEKENHKLRKENEDLRKGQDTMKGKLALVENSTDNIEQNKIKDDIMVTGDFSIEPLSALKFSQLMKTTCNAELDATKINKISSFKNKSGQTVVRVNISDVATRIALFKNKKTLVEKKVFVSEALTANKFQLLMAAKSLCKSKVLFSAWSKAGNIFAKKSEQSMPQLIRDRAHLDTLANN